MVAECNLYLLKIMRPGEGWTCGSAAVSTDALVTVLVIVVVADVVRAEA